MKWLSVIVAVCIVFLSFAGFVPQHAGPDAKDMCCMKKNAGACNRNKSEKQNKDCEKHGCAVMFSCSTCGFLRTERLQLKETFAKHIPKPVSLYIIGDLSAYHSSNWKPPKVC
ncbi:MAG TPA: hypothetical protein VHA56_19060 [Mucilaginibacter sp.]|nr:hypothetical protein [Mucilaginibacter sp.]